MSDGTTTPPDAQPTGDEGKAKKKRKGQYRLVEVHAGSDKVVYSSLMELGEAKAAAEKAAAGFFKDKAPEEIEGKTFALVFVCPAFKPVIRTVATSVSLETTEPA